MIVLNPIAGGGLSGTKLALATASAADVLSGKTFYAGGKTLKTGTLTTPKFTSGTFSCPDFNNSTTITLPFAPRCVIVYLSYYQSSGASGTNRLLEWVDKSSGKQSARVTGYDDFGIIVANTYTSLSNKTLTFACPELDDYGNFKGKSVNYYAYG